jgi:NADPH:quinone reductase-like Zn-dependent oxidoreductase
MSEATSQVKSWVYTSAGYPDTLKFTTSSVPAKPESSSVLVQVHAASLNPVDIQLMNLPLNSLPYLNGPKTPGRDFSGTILAAGSETEFQKGDEVFGIITCLDGTGFLTEVAHVSMKGACIVKKPKHLNWVQAASLPLVYLTARTSIERCKPFMKAASPADNKVVVLGGSSATGMYTIQIAKRLGWKVLSSCSSRNTDFVKGLGADELVDYTSSPAAVVNAVRKFGPHAIVDCVGGTECIGLAPKYVTIVGDKTSRSSMGGSSLYLTHPRMVVRWILGYFGLSNSYDCIILEPRKEWLEEATQLDPENIVIDSTFGFDKALEAFERLNTGRARGKVVVEIKQ